MVKAVLYIIAAIVGLFLRTIVAHAIGVQYTIDGHDLVVAAACIAIVWAFLGNKPDKKRRNNK